MKMISEKIASTALPQQNEMIIGRLLLESGKITAQDAERILQAQKQNGLRFGEAAIKLGLVKEEDIQTALAKQFDYPCLAKGEGDLGSELVAAYEPHSPQVETLRAVRAQLLLRWFKTGNKRLALASPTSNTGCSHVAANLAVVFSQLGERTLLIDGNLRTPRQHQIFNLGNRAGLSEILAGRANLEVIARISPLKELSVMTSGATPPNPLELLGRDNLSGLLDHLSALYDVILIDTPPANEFGDAQSIAAHAGGALLVARKSRTRLSEIEHLKTALTATSTPIAGAVLNQF